MYDLEKHLAAFSAANWSEWKELLAKDVVYDEVPTSTRVTGPDDYLKSVQRWKRAFPDMRATIKNQVRSGDKIVAEVDWEGTQTGPIETPFGPIAPSNKRGVMRAALFVTVRNDKVVELHHYFDMVTLLANAGVAPFTAMIARPAKTAAATTPRP